MLRLLLVRHGETEANARHIYQGHTDYPLNQKGLQQAQRLAVRLAAQPVDIVFSSDLSRSVETAKILVGSREIEIHQDQRLREMKFGMLEGHTFDDALEQWPDMMARWLEDNNQPLVGGESMDEFTQRVSECFTDIMQGCEGKTVLIVAHGGSLRVVIQGLLKTSSVASCWFSLDNASLTDFQIEDEMMIVNRLNDAGHLISP